jgi:transcriptional regulator with XRE-family HTH domain
LANSVNKNLTKWQVASGFEERLREAFGRAALTEVARKTGENYHTVRNWAKNKRDPPPRFLIAVAELTNCSLNWLLTGTEPKTVHGDKLVGNRAESKQQLSPELRFEIRKEIYSVLRELMGSNEGEAIFRALLSSKDIEFVESLLKVVIPKKQSK